MTIFFFVIGILQCLLIWVMGLAGFRLNIQAAQQRESAIYPPPGGWPTVGLIIPVAGIRPHTEEALRSLLTQSYPKYTPCIVTDSNQDPAQPLIHQLQREFPFLVHVNAGLSSKCGQKNHNLLAGLTAMSAQVEIFAFCDSTHLANPDFLSCLVEPLYRHKAEFATGYHQVRTLSSSLPVLGYTLSVLFMRLLQGISGLTQPWGGAMAMTRKAFIDYKIAALWENNIVDDCSLAGLLVKKGVKTYLAPGALLTTFADQITFGSWQAWLTRQILFLKFCIPSQWLALGCLCFLMIGPSLWALWAIIMGIIGAGGGAAPFLALCWGFFLAWAINRLRMLLPEKSAATPWLTAFFCSSVMFTLVYCKTLLTRQIIWNKITYQVGKGGKVISRSD